eukprot:scaffold35107_cov28-Tisochrysis_lutea.AAC.3
MGGIGSWMRMGSEVFEIVSSAPLSSRTTIDVTRSPPPAWTSMAYETRASCKAESTGSVPFGIMTDAELPPASIRFAITLDPSMPSALSAKRNRMVSTLVPIVRSSSPGSIPAISLRLILTTTWTRRSERSLLEQLAFAALPFMAPSLSLRWESLPIASSAAASLLSTGTV